MLIDEIHTFIEFLKNQGQNIYHSPEQIDDAINRASLDLFRQEEKVFERSQIITDTLRPFKVKKSDYTGTSPFALPEGYIRATNVSHVYKSNDVISTEDESVFCDSVLNTDPNTNDVVGIEKEIDLITDGDWVKRQDSVIVGPTDRNPIARVYGSSLEVLPSTVVPVLYYLKEPIKAVWAYTISEDGRSFVFNESASVDLEWSLISHNEIIEKAVSSLGFAVRDQVMMQYESFQKKNNNES